MTSLLMAMAMLCQVLPQDGKESGTIWAWKFKARCVKSMLACIDPKAGELIARIEARAVECAKTMETNP